MNTLIVWTIAMAGLAIASTCQAQQSGGAADSLESIGKEYTASVQPLVKQYCLDCHSTAKKKGKLDLEQFASLAAIRRSPRTWQKVVEQLELGEMPPEDKPQPTAKERERIEDWIRRYLHAEALANAGDPGRVVLRRLNNAEYTYTIRDLTGVDLDPAREFPGDSAAGEGFTNTGGAMAMSPALVTKYFDAGKSIALHAALRPDGIRFTTETTRRDRTNALMDEIRAFYRDYTDPRAGEKVNLQGIVFETNGGGRLPIEKYLAATIEWRDAPKDGAPSLERFAAERGLSPKYLRILLESLTSKERSQLLDPIRARWSTAKLADVAALSTEIAQWQKSLFKFSSVGHIGKVGGPTRWLETVTPLATRQDVRLKMPTPTDNAEVVISLVISDAGDGNENDFVIWNQPRLVIPGRPDVLLRDVRSVSQQLTERRAQFISNTAAYLNAAAEAAASQTDVDVKQLAAKHDLEADTLKSWLDYLGVGVAGSVKIDGLFTSKIEKSSSYDFIKGWGSDQTPLLIANSSDEFVRVPGDMKPHSIAVHPSPTIRAAVGWKSPITGMVRVESDVVDAHTACGNGVTWMLELRRGSTRQRLASGATDGNKPAKFGPLDKLAMHEGDVVSLLIGPRDSNHVCDLTAVDLRITADGDAGARPRVWDLAKDVSPDVLAGNPHADSLGNKGVWYFYTEPDKDTAKAAPAIPAGSLLAKWQVAASASEKQSLAVEVQKLLTTRGAGAAENSPDATLYKQLMSLDGPILAGVLRRASEQPAASANANAPQSSDDAAWGLDPALFGKHPDGSAIDGASLCVRGPSVLEIRLPVELAVGGELVTSAALDPRTGGEGSVQVQAIVGKASPGTGLIPSGTTVNTTNGQWTGNNRSVSYAAPIIVNENSAARKRIEAGFDAFRALFPAALCYEKIVPVDEVVTLTLFYREDDNLERLMLNDSEKARLDQLWSELHYNAQDALTLVDGLEQLIQFATQDADPKVFEPLRKPFKERADKFRKWLLETEPAHVDAIVALAGRAYRRPLSAGEEQGLRNLYKTLREEEMSHDEAIRLMIARVLTSPAFLYRLENPGPGAKPSPVSDLELANRLSYFLWSSMPDAELRDLAASGRLHEPEVLVAQAHRMLQDDRVRRLAIEFGCQWIHLRDFDQLDEKSERHFPTFRALRGDMYEESIQFITDLFRGDRSVLNIVDADYVFLNERLAKHYGIPGVAGDQWRRVDGVRQYARGGILTQAAMLSKQSGASRTSPTLRGDWLTETLLGEKLPRPPKGVPPIPDDETATEGLTVRQIVERHAADPACSKCHRRVDAFGFALEDFDAIGRFRDKDMAGRPLDTKVALPDGTKIDGLVGLRDYLVNTRRDAFVAQFCRKLLGFSLGRGVQLSDEPLLTEMAAQLKQNDYRFSAAVETIVRSKQFREIRGRDVAYDEEIEDKPAE